VTHETETEEFVHCECLWEPTEQERVTTGDNCPVHPKPQNDAPTWTAEDRAAAIAHKLEAINGRTAW
jgi:hypothetical protein